jgi:hypothetical protein
VYGRNDPAQRENRGDDFVPKGLGQFNPLAAG